MCRQPDFTSDMEKEENMDRNLAWRYRILQRLTRRPEGLLGILYSVFRIQVTCKDSVQQFDVVASENKAKEIYTYT